MSVIEAIGIAGSLSLLAGWRLYASIFATGLAMRLGMLELPSHLESLDALASPWVIAAAAIGFLAELLADKIPWVDSIWDAINTFTRPVGGALLALAVLDPSSTTWQIVILLLGGSAALVSHGAKAGTRLIANASPEPVSNIVLSSIEDVVTAGGLWLVLAFPAAAFVVALLLAALAAALIFVAAKMWRRIRPR
jgi:hypothetical protein